MRRFLGSSTLILLTACGENPSGCTQLEAAPPPTHEEACFTASRIWAVLGLAPEQVPDTPDQLLTARLHVGETAALQATTLTQPGDCNDLVASVAWRSTAPSVADVVPEATLSLSGRLEARRPGETALSAEVKLQDGTVRHAELYAVPDGRHTQLRVYSITVTR